MYCPNCQKQIKQLTRKIKRKGNKNILTSACPNCNFIFKKEETKFSQTTRIIFIIIVIPLAMFLTVFSLYFLDNLSSFNFIFLWSSPAILIVGCFLIIQFIKKSIDPKVVLKDEYEKYDLKKKTPGEDSPKKSENIYDSSDPLMSQIRENAAKLLNKPEANIKSNKNILHKRILVVIIGALIIIPSLREMYLLNNKRLESKNKLREELLDQRLGNISNTLEELYKQENVYPNSLDHPRLTATENFHESIRGEFEEELFGQVIHLSDLEYISDGNSYILCFKSNILSKCYNSHDHK